MKAATDTTPEAPATGAVTATLVMIVTVIAFESMAISAIMPQVGAVLDAGSGYGLAFSAMFTAQLVGIVVAAPGVSRFGALLPTWIGLGLFALGSLLAGVSTSFGILILGRIVAGFGAGLAVVALFVIVGQAFPEGARPRVMAWLSTAWVLPSILGPIVAAALAQLVSWRFVFLVVVPLSVVAGLGLLPVRRLARPASADGSDDVSPRRVAVRTAWLGLAVAATASAIQWASGALPIRDAGQAALVVAAAAVGTVGLAASLRELLPPGSLRLRRGLPALMSSKFFLTAGMNGSTTFVPLALVTTRGLTLAEAGAFLTVTSLGWTCGSWLQSQSRRETRDKAHRFVVRGAACVAAGLFALGLLLLVGPTWSLGGALVLIGLGMGMSMSSMSVLMLSLAPPAQHARASSSLQLTDVLGSAIGIAAIGAFYAAGSRGPATFALMTLLGSGLALVAAWAGRRTRLAVRA